ncbi:hypothetical protein AX760_23945 [Pararhizobium antarcticum]|uniref:Uncharacterized protein n=1 Tax=Pararhizobium antarcticum TaxID=1798805 RepID=A0A657LLC0_9HYPH|nr:hypothetical protein AX760_23945 [Pararhizobium antarcticum]OJF99448.1 hypothetical protein AX761_10680 [Rhizobium sp. 58]
MIMRDTQAVIERTQQILAQSRAFRERCEAGREELKARIELAQVPKGQLHFVFPTKVASRAH